MDASVWRARVSSWPASRASPSRTPVLKPRSTVPMSVATWARCSMQHRCTASAPAASAALTGLVALAASLALSAQGVRAAEVAQLFTNSCAGVHTLWLRASSALAEVPSWTLRVPAGSAKCCFARPGALVRRQSRMDAKGYHACTSAQERAARAQVLYLAVKRHALLACCRARPLAGLDWLSCLTGRSGCAEPATQVRTCSDTVQGSPRLDKSTQRFSSGPSYRGHAAGEPMQGGSGFQA